jgi:hypothetical protein
MGRRGTGIGGWACRAYQRVAPIALTSLLFLDAHESPLSRRPYADPCPLAHRQLTFEPRGDRFASRLQWQSYLMAG